MRRTAHWIVVSLGLLVLVVAAGGTTYAQEQPKPTYVFDISVSLEWQPGYDDRLPDALAASGCSTSGAASTYIADLQAGLRSTSAYLYTYSRGEMALGTVTIYTNGENWDSSQIRVLADNSYRPSAYIGGAVQVPTPYVAGANKQKQIFYPGAIFLGRAWNGAGGRCGLWTMSNGWRTIGHEWAHYALYLYDDYYNQNTLAPQYCTTSGRDITRISPTDPNIATTDTLMAYHYRSDHLWIGTTTPSVCLNTPQRRVHGTSDWIAIKRFFPQVTIPTKNDTGPAFRGSPAEALFSTVIGSASPVANTVAKINMRDTGSRTLPAETFIYRPGEGGDPARIIGQGQLFSDENGTSYGAHEVTKDRLIAAAQNPITNERLEYPGDYRSSVPLDLKSLNVIEPVPAVWRPSVQITPLLTWNGNYADVTGLRVQFKDCTSNTKRIQIAYCPAGGSCDRPVSVSMNAQGSFAYTLPFPADQNNNTPALKGYLYIRDPSFGREMVVPYQLAGGVGPATITGHAPLAEPSFEVDPLPGASPLTNQDSLLLIGGTQECSLTASSLPANVHGIVGSPVYIQPVKSNRKGEGWTAQDGELRVRITYSQDHLNRADINESRLVLLRLVAGDRVFVPALGRSYEMDWIAGRAQTFNGAGAYFALGYR